MIICKTSFRNWFYFLKLWVEAANHFCWLILFIILISNYCLLYIKSETKQRKKTNKQTNQANKQTYKKVLCLFVLQRSHTLITWTILQNIYINKFAMSVCVAMRSAVLLPMELKLGMGVGFGELGEPSTFRRDPTGQRSSRGQVAQECPMATKFGE